ncbi:MAG TPA: Mur ligase family protein [Candidatus Paceibacterota bacterium]|nr:Mur ligase family protein [Candidatus Paceibacterota bacterium]
MIKLDTIKKAHMVGIGGIGMSGLAQLLLDRGVLVTGSDRSASPVTELLGGKGIEVQISEHAANVPTDADVLIYTEALAEDNAERERARELGIPEYSYFAMLGAVSEGKRTIAVSGTHGKTTTTGMLARILRDAQVSPTAIIGSLVRDFGSNYLKGESEWFVVEACEYKRDFLTLSPEILVITNLELDHTDYYKDIEDVQDAFRELARKVPSTGFIVTDATHPNIAPLLEGLEATIVDYTKETAHETRFPGEHNKMNARAAAAASRLAVPTLTDEDLAKSLAAFEGTWRRFEYKGKTKSGALVYDDYAHHPTAVRKTVAELRARTSGKVFIAFHPHLFSRTRDLFEDFAVSFRGADQVLLAPIYAAREIDDGTVSSELLAARITENGVSAEAMSFEEITRVLEEAPVAGDIIMTMGAGDIYKVADELVR